VVCNEIFEEIVELWGDDSEQYIMKILPKLLAKIGSAMSECQKNSPQPIKDPKSLFVVSEKYKMALDSDSTTSHVKFASQKDASKTNSVKQSPVQENLRESESN